MKSENLQNKEINIIVNMFNLQKKKFIEKIVVKQTRYIITIDNCIII